MINVLIFSIALSQMSIGQSKDNDPFGDCWPEPIGYYDLADFVLDGRSKQVEIVNEKDFCGIYIKVVNPRISTEYCEFDIFLIQVYKIKECFLDVDFFQFSEREQIKVL